MDIGTVTLNAALAGLLFLFINWLGRHAEGLGYGSATLFGDVSESPALNFIIRALGPTVYIVALATGFIAAGFPDVREGLYLTVILYFAMRVGYILLWGRRYLVSWPRIILQVTVGIAAALWAHNRLIIPQTPLLPDLQTFGNELWLAIIAFLYAVANKIQLQPGPSASRRNNYIRSRYRLFRERFGDIISSKLPDRRAQLIAYSVLIYEDYCRPPAVRLAERALFPHFSKTTGVMQVGADKSLTDRESVEKGVEIIAQSWEQRWGTSDPEGRRWEARWDIIGDYNRDSDYISAVEDVMSTLAFQIDTDYEPDYRAMLDE